MFSVLGAGVTGLCVATALVERGAQVELIDPMPFGASWLAGGMLAPDCEGESAPPEVVAAGGTAADWWAARFNGVVRRGTLVVAQPRDRAELTRFARATQNHETLEPAELEPDLLHFPRALFYRREAHMNPRSALMALTDRLRRNDVPITEGTPKGRVIDCTGMDAKVSGLRAVRGEMLIVHAPDVTLTRTIRLLHPRFPCYIVPRGDDRYMIGATMVESRDNRPITARAVMELLSAAYTVHPGFAEASVLETAAGLRPAFSNNTPQIRHEHGRIYVNGMYRHGFLMAPYIAETLATQLTQVAYAH